MASNTERDEKSFNPMSEMASFSKQGLNEFVKAQAALMEKFQDANRRWFDRWQAEAKLLSDLGAKLTAARSLTDTAAACQDFSKKQWEMANEDAKRFIAESEALTRSGAQMFSGKERTGAST
jgi:hypothetical protein